MVGNRRKLFKLAAAALAVSVAGIGAANLALELRNSYPNDERARAASDAVIESVKAENVLVDVRCDEQCTIEVDGTVLRHPAFFTMPYVEHCLNAISEIVAAACARRCRRL